MAAGAMGDLLAGDGKELKSCWSWKEMLLNSAELSQALFTQDI